MVNYVDERKLTTINDGGKEGMCRTKWDVLGTFLAAVVIAAGHASAHSTFIHSKIIKKVNRTHTHTHRIQQNHLHIKKGVCVCVFFVFYRVNKYHITKVIIKEEEKEEKKKKL